MTPAEEGFAAALFESEPIKFKIEIDGNDSDLGRKVTVFVDNIICHSVKCYTREEGLTYARGFKAAVQLLRPAASVVIETIARMRW